MAAEIKTIPTVVPTAETPNEVRQANSQKHDLDNAPDADDPAIYLHPENPERSFVIGSFKNGGLRIYNLKGEEIESVTPPNIRYNNVDIAYGVEYSSQVAGETATVDLAIASDRANDTIAIFAINPQGSNSQLPGGKILTDVTSVNIPQSIFGVDDGEATAYGLATYTSPSDRQTYVFVSQADGDRVAQLKLEVGLGAADGLEVNAKVVRILQVPVPQGKDPADYQVEGMVVDRQTGELYLAQEEFGIWKYNAEPNSDEEPILVDTVERSNLTADIEGLTMYYGEDGKGYLLASSQGDNTFAIYNRAGDNSYLGSFAIARVEQTDGLDVINTPLGENYPAGLLVVQDGNNELETDSADSQDGNTKQFNTNFKFVSLADLNNVFPNLSI